MSKMYVSIHQPLWGGFPMHWIKGDPASPEFTRDEKFADKYDGEQLSVLDKELKRQVPNAVVRHIPAGN